MNEIQTVYLRHNRESGAWMYTLSSANRIESSVVLASGESKPISVRQRAKDNEGNYINDPAQGTYNYHYVLFDEEYTGCDKSELTNDGWTDSALLNVMDGTFELVDA